MRWRLLVTVLDLSGHLRSGDQLTASFPADDDMDDPGTGSSNGMAAVRQ